MSPRVIAAFLLTFALLGGVGTVMAQSLADVAKEEAARRQALPATGKLYTNKDLPNVAPATVDAGHDGKPDEKAGEKAEKSSEKNAASADKTNDGDKAKDGDKPKDQKYWSDRLKDLQASLDRDQLYADALQSRINALTTDFVNHDDPAQRAVIGEDRQKALDELGRLKETIDTDKKAIAGFEEDARRADVPPGWLR